MTQLELDKYNELLNRKIHQFLVHSFLYYGLNTSTREDSFYDEVCFDLLGLKKTGDYTKHKYASYIEDLDESASAYYIDKYPPQIISIAFHLLYSKADTDETFTQFTARWGYGGADS